MMRVDADTLVPGKCEPIADGALVFDGPRILYSGPSEGAPTMDSDSIRVPALMPGMWDCHGHFAGMAKGDLVANAAENAAVKAARATADMAATLQGGITSVREVGGMGIFIRKAVYEGRISGPHIYSAGDMLSPTGGHADVHEIPLAWAMSPHTARSSYTCDGIPEVLKAVRLQLRRGADLIKICASGGVMSEFDNPIHQQFSDEELRAIVEEAARSERAVAAHCHGKSGIMAAIDAGVTTIEHGTYLDAEAAEAMVESGTILVPTCIASRGMIEMKGIIPDYAYEKGVVAAEHHARALSIAIEYGVTLAAGTDIFLSDDSHGTNSRETKHLIDAGLTPLQAVEATTANGPLTLGLQAPASGQLREGFDADIVAFDTNPLEDPSVWGDPSRVTHVWKTGELVKGHLGSKALRAHSSDAADPARRSNRDAS